MLELNSLLLRVVKNFVKRRSSDLSHTGVTLQQRPKLS
jgi:hypothetical protein